MVSLSCQLSCLWGAKGIMPGAGISLPDCTAGSQPDVLALPGRSGRALTPRTAAVGGRRCHSPKLLSGVTGLEMFAVTWRCNSLVLSEKLGRHVSDGSSSSPCEDMIRGSTRRTKLILRLFAGIFQFPFSPVPIKLGNWGTSSAQ